MPLPKSKLMLGDCMELLNQVKKHSIDLVLVDLPYGTTKNEWDQRLDLPRLWKHYDHVCRGTFVFTASQPFSSLLVVSCLKKFRHSWVWHKSKATGHLNAKKCPMKIHEDVLVFAKFPKYNPQGLKPLGRTVTRGNNGTNFGDSHNQNFQEFTNYPRSVLRFDSVTKVHPTQKPVALMEYLIKTYSDEGDTVLDNCMGSGSTGVAAVKCGRRFIGMEKDLRHFQMAESRIRGAERCLRSS